MANQQIRQITIKVDSSGSPELKDLADKISGVNKNTKSLADSFGFLRGAFATFLAGLSIREIAGISDSMQQLRDRIKILSGSTEQANEIFSELTLRANRSKVGITDLATTYTRFAASTSSLKLSNSTLLTVVETLQNAFRLSGTTAEEAAGATIQLSQAFSLGKLQGQELRSVMLGSVEIARILQKEYGTNLKKAAEEGLITPAKLVTLLLKESERLNSTAQKLTPTFGQSLTIAMNNFSVAIDDVNRRLSLSSGFGQLLQVVTEKTGLLITAIGILALTTLPLLLTSLGAIAKAFFVFIGANPLVLLLGAISIAIVSSFKDLDEFASYLTFTYIQIANFFDKINLSVREFIKAGALTGVSDEFNKSIKDIQDRIANRNAVEVEIFTPSNDAIERQKKDLQNKKDLAADIERLLKLANAGKESKLKDILGAINKEFLAGKLTAEQYFEKLDGFEVTKLTRNFRDGKIQLDAYSEGFEKLERRQITREFNQGRLSLEEFNKAIQNSQVDSLNLKLRSGVINLQEYDNQLLKISNSLNGSSALRSGVSSYIESIGTLGTNTADLIKKTFSSLEDVFLDFTKTGKADFAKFTQAILDDLLRIIIRASIIRPLANGILGALTNSAGTTGAQAGGTSGNFTGAGSGELLAAHGAAFDNGVRKFASGGIVTRPTAFGYGNGKTGLMGEAGTEAILPLARGSGGDLGVKASLSPVTININNQANADIQQSETSGPNGERTIDLLIRSKVKDGIANGSFDKSFATAFGLSRRGS